MKAIQLAALLSILATSTAFAQSNPATATRPDTTGTTVAMSNATPQTGGWVPPYGEAVAPKTGAQVYGQLAQAEKNGQLAYLNSTIFAHP